MLYEKLIVTISLIVFINDWFMTLQELRFIVTLAQLRHFGKAAASCFVSQPTLSIAIKKIEEELQVQLFERQKNQLFVTPTGKKVCEAAHRILAEVENIKLIAKDDQDDTVAPLKLGAIYTIGPYIFPGLITQFKKIAPKIPLEIHEDFTVNLKEKLRDGKIDAAIISLPFNDPLFKTCVLYKENFVVLMPAKHPLAENSQITENMLCKYHVLMLGENHCFKDQVVSSCPKCFNHKKSTKYDVQTVEGSSLETIRYMVATGLGLTILPETAAKMGSNMNALLITRPLKVKSPTRTVVLAWRKSFPRMKIIEKVIKAVSNTQLNGAFK